MDANELVTVYTVNDPMKAEILKVELQAEGIACTIGGEHQAGFTGVFEIAIQVRAQDADRAEKFIRQHEEHKQ